MTNSFGIPDENRRAAAVLLAIMQANGGKWSGKTTLAKAFWWAHVVSLRDRGAELTEHRIIARRNGPLPEAMDALVEALTFQPFIRHEKGSEAYEPHRFELTEDAQGLINELTPSEIACVREGANKFRQLSGTQASKWSHYSSRAWNEVEQDEPMNVALDVDPDDTSFEQGKTAAKEAEDELLRVFRQR